jgi:hypothetical protein
MRKCRPTTKLMKEILEFYNANTQFNSKKVNLYESEEFFHSIKAKEY